MTAAASGMYGVDPEGAAWVPARTRTRSPGENRAATPPGHVRAPWYCRGRRGVVERLCGAFANPEELAYGRPGLPAQPLYRVRFQACELWPDYREDPADVIDIEIYQHWLEAAREGAP